MLPNGVTLLHTDTELSGRKAKQFIWTISVNYPDAENVIRKLFEQLKEK